MTTQIEEVKKAQDHWDKAVNKNFIEMSNEINTVRAVQTINNPVDFINGVTGISRIQYIQLEKCKLVSLTLTGVTIPNSLLANYFSHIASVPDEFRPEAEIQHSIRYGANFHLYPDGTGNVWNGGINKDAGDSTAAFTCQMTYFTAN